MGSSGPTLPDWDLVEKLIADVAKIQKRLDRASQEADPRYYNLQCLEGSLASTNVVAISIMDQYRDHYSPGSPDTEATVYHLVELAEHIVAADTAYLRLLRRYEGGRERSKHAGPLDTLAVCGLIQRFNYHVEGWKADGASRVPMAILRGDREGENALEFKREGAGQIVNRSSEYCTSPGGGQGRKERSKSEVDYESLFKAEASKRRGEVTSLHEQLDAQKGESARLEKRMTRDISELREELAALQARMAIDQPITSNGATTPQHTYQLPSALGLILPAADASTSPTVTAPMPSTQPIPIAAEGFPTSRRSSLYRPPPPLGPRSRSSISCGSVSSTRSASPITPPTPYLPLQEHTQLPNSECGNPISGIPLTPFGGGQKAADAISCSQEVRDQPDSDEQGSTGEWTVVDQEEAVHWVAVL